MVVVEGLQQTNKMCRSSQDDKNVKELMRSSPYVEACRIPLLRYSSLRVRQRDENILAYVLEHGLQHTVLLP